MTRRRASVASARHVLNRAMLGGAVLTGGIGVLHANAGHMDVALFPYGLLCALCLIALRLKPAGQ